MSALDKLQSGLEQVHRVFDQHGDCEVGGPGEGGEEDTPIYNLSFAIEYLREAEAALECGCRDGVLWPWGTDSDRSHDWIERCDECATHESDDEAAKALADSLGCSVTWSQHPTLDRLAPHIDLPR